MAAGNAKASKQGWICCCAQLAAVLPLFVSVSQALDAPLLQRCEVCECMLHKGHVWHDQTFAFTLPVDENKAQ